MLVYGDGFHSDSITGVALGVGSASASALFKVSTRGGDFNSSHVTLLNPKKICSSERFFIKRSLSFSD